LRRCTGDEGARKREKMETNREVVVYIVEKQQQTPHTKK
jgi:hypothetical protein